MTNDEMMIMMMQRAPVIAQCSLHGMRELPQMRRMDAGRTCIPRRSVLVFGAAAIAAAHFPLFYLPATSPQIPV